MVIITDDVATFRLRCILVNPVHLTKITCSCFRYRFVVVQTEADDCLE